MSAIDFAGIDLSAVSIPAIGGIVTLGETAPDQVTVTSTNGEKP